MRDAVSVPRQVWNVTPALLAALAGAFALAVGLAVGDSGSGMLVPVGIAIGLLAVTAVVVWPFAGFLALVFSLFFLVVVFVPSHAAQRQRLRPRPVPPARGVPGRQCPAGEGEA